MAGKRAHKREQLCQCARKTWGSFEFWDPTDDKIHNEGKTKLTMRWNINTDESWNEMDDWRIQGSKAQPT